MSEIDFLAIGHVTRDVVGDHWTPGGTAAYAAWTAARLGRAVGILTSGAFADFRGRLPGVLFGSAAPETTTFVNVYSPEGRKQWVRSVAAPITGANVPDEVRNAPIVLLGPVIGEVDRRIGDRFPTALIVATAQGWLRRREADGAVGRAPWPDAMTIGGVRIVVLSDEDVGGDESLARRVASGANVLALTRGKAGVRLFQEGRVTDVPGYPVVEHNPTGAGDVFAASFAIRLAETGDLAEAADFANAAASLLVESAEASLERRIPDRSRIAKRRSVAER